MSTQRCFTASELQNWLDGASSTAVEQHVRDCSACQATLEQVCSIGEWKISSNSKRFQCELPDESECQEILSKWKRIGADAQIDTLVSRTTPNASSSLQGLPKPGQILGHYCIVRELGRGGMSIVYEATDLKLNRSVALKLLQGQLLDGSDLARFLREANAIAAIQHPNVVTIHEIQSESDNSVPYLIMEYVDGPTLHDRIHSDAPIPFRTTAVWVASLADALAAAHRNGIVHRDIKPSNILLARSGQSLHAPITPDDQQEEWTPKLADFGLAQTEHVDSQLTQSGFLTGTPAYASPEQALADRVSTASDIYSLGVTLFEALTGELPYRGTPHAVIRQILDESFPNPRSLNPAIPTDLETICLKACHHDPSRRYESANDFAADLRRWHTGRPIHARPISSWERCRSWVGRNRRVAALLSIVFALLATIAVGSVGATFAMATARSLIAKEANEAELARDQAEKASKTANEQSVIAQQQRKLAVDALRSLVDEVQSKLANRAGTLQVRQELLRTALNGFEKLSTGGEDNSIVDHNRVDALIQLASIHSSLGNRDEAKKVVDQAVAAAEVRYRDITHDDTAVTDLAEAIALQADLSFAISANDNAGSLYAQALSLLDTAAKSSELSPKHRKIQFLCTQKRIGIDSRAKRITDAILKLEAMLPELEKLWDEFPTRIDLRRIRIIGLIQLANEYASVDLDKYRSSLVSAIDLTNELRKQDPENYGLVSDVTMLQARLARQEREAGHFEEAVVQATAAVESVLSFAAMDRTNLAAQSQVGMVYDVQYEALLHAGRLEEATHAAKNGYDAHAATLKASPRSLRCILLTGESAAKVSDTYLRRRDYGQAVDWMKRCLVHYDQGRDLPDATRESWEVYREMMESKLAAMEFAIANNTQNPLFVDRNRDLQDVSSCALIASLDGRYESMERWIAETVERIESGNSDAKKVKADVGILQGAGELNQRKLAWRILIKALMVASIAKHRESEQEASDAYRNRAIKMTKADWYPEAELRTWLKSEPDTHLIERQ